MKPDLSGTRGFGYFHRVDDAERDDFGRSDGPTCPKLVVPHHGRPLRDVFRVHVREERAKEWFRHRGEWLRLLADHRSPDRGQLRSVARKLASFVDGHDHGHDAPVRE
jgi:hypothetical protein